MFMVSLSILLDSLVVVVLISMKIALLMLEALLIIKIQWEMLLLHLLEFLVWHLCKMMPAICISIRLSPTFKMVIE